MKAWGAIGVALLLGMVLGCTKAEQANVRDDARGLGQQVQGAAQSAKAVAENATLSAKVKSALLTRKGLDAGKIDVAADGPVVTLKGLVGNRAQAEAAERVARETTGVNEVHNQLAVAVPAKAMPAGG